MSQLIILQIVVLCTWKIDCNDLIAKKNPVIQLDELLVKSKKKLRKIADVCRITRSLTLMSWLGEYKKWRERKLTFDTWHSFMKLMHFYWIINCGNMKCTQVMQIKLCWTSLKHWKEGDINLIALILIFFIFIFFYDCKCTKQKIDVNCIEFYCLSWQISIMKLFSCMKMMRKMTCDHFSLAISISIVQIQFNWMRISSTRIVIFLDRNEKIPVHHLKLSF